MKLVKCTNGHYYDGDKYSKCPHCNAEGEDAATPEVENNNQAKGRMVVVEPKETEAINENKQENNDPKTIGHYGLEKERDPVVGWLVCIEGEEQGNSYMLKAGRNFIGRAASNDVVISEDNYISREKHAIVIYDPKSRNFMVQPGMSNELFYVNDNVVLQAGTIKNKDILSLGKTKLMFVPFCGEEFSWDDLGLGK